MNLFKNSLILSCIALLVFSGCKNDLKLNAPYKEIPSIYAVLNPYESLQMIRVNKIFLGEEDANKMAKIADSVNYKQDEISVTLIHSVSPKVITFHDSIVTTANGSFNTTQRIYVSGEKLETTGTYTLIVKNSHTGNVFTSTANPIGQVSKDVGNPFPPPYYPYAPGTDPNSSAYINYSLPTSTSTRTNNVYWHGVENAKVYKLIIRNDFYNDLGATRSYDNVDFVVDDPKEIRKISGENYINVRFTSADFYGSLGLALSRKNLSTDIVGRKMWLMEYIVYASTQEYVDYNEFLKPSLSLNQNKPLYSNFKDKAALGLFTFRSTQIVQKELYSGFVDSYSTNSNTCKYKFYNFNNQLGGCK